MNSKMRIKIPKNEDLRLQSSIISNKELKRRATRNRHPSTKGTQQQKVQLIRRKHNAIKGSRIFNG